MAFKGHQRQGFCPLTITTTSEGVTSEALGKGKITKHVVSFNGTVSDSSTDLWAGDVKEQSERQAEGSVQLVLSQLSLEDEAALGGHEYSAETGMTEKEGDEAPYVRYAAIGLGSRINDATGAKETFYRLLKYYKVQFGPIDDVLKTKQQSPAYETHSAAGKSYYNEDGDMRTKQDFATFADALKEMKAFLNITG